MKFKVLLPSHFFVVPVRVKRYEKEDFALSKKSNFSHDSQTIVRRDLQSTSNSEVSQTNLNQIFLLNRKRNDKSSSVTVFRNKYYTRRSVRI